MYSKVVYDYFNSNPKKFEFKPNKLIRTNAFKKKSTKKAVVVSTKSNTSTKILNNSSPIENASQKPTQTTAVNVVYDAVQCIWKYAKSFISNQNADASRHQDRLRKNIKKRSSSSNNHLKSLRNVPFDTFPRDVTDEKEKPREPVKVTNEKLNSEHIPQDITEEANLHDKKVDEDFMTIEKLETSINLQELAPSITGINFENPENDSVCKELDLYLTDSYNEKSINCDIANKEIQTIKLVDEDVSFKIPIKKNQHKNKLTEIYIKQQDLQNNQDKSENLNLVEMQIPKSSMKTYGRGKRRNKKLLHVHFKDENDNEKPKHTTCTSKKLRKSDCYHPNAFYKKFVYKQMLEKKKRSKHNSSSSISFQSKLPDSYKNKPGTKTCKTPKNCPVFATAKIYNRKHTKNCKKEFANKEDIKILQEVIKSIADNKFDEPINISHNDTNELLKAFNIDDELRNPHHSKYLLESENDNLFGKNQIIYESNNFLEELNEFVDFINEEQSNVSSFE